MPDFDPKAPGFFAQQVMLIGTYDEDGNERFAPISWVSYTWGPPPCLVVSIWGAKRTKDNIARTGLFSATVVTPDLLPLVEQCNRRTYRQEAFDAVKRREQKGTALSVPLLEGASYSFECKLLQTATIGESMTYFGQIEHINMSDEIKAMDFFDLRTINPVIYSPNNYFAVGEHLGAIGDYSK